MTLTHHIQAILSHFCFGRLEPQDLLSTGQFKKTHDQNIYSCVTYQILGTCSETLRFEIVEKPCVPLACLPSDQVLTSNL